MLGAQNCIEVSGTVVDVSRVVENKAVPVSTDSKKDKIRNQLSHKVPTQNPVSIAKTSSNLDASGKKQQTKILNTDPWNDKETKFILDKYETYLTQVGPMKKFKMKKVMWTKISSDLLDELDCKRDYTQVENRYKTCLKRKKTAGEHNAKSGNARKEVPFEDGLSKIAANDDSIEPEVLCSAKKMRYLKEPTEKKTVDKEKKYARSCRRDIYEKRGSQKTKTPRKNAVDFRPSE